MDNAVRVLIHALRKLDLLLQHALAASKSGLEPEPASAFRGLYIAPEEAARLLNRDPGVPTLGAVRADSGSLIASPAEFPPLARLQDAFGLSPFDLDVLVIALAPELDLRYERLYAYLQDDITRRRPSVDLVLNLLCSTAEEKLARRGSFALEAPLIRNGLLRLVPDPNHVQPPLLAHCVKLDEQVVRWLTEEKGQDRRLESCCRTQKYGHDQSRQLEQQPIGTETQLALRSLVRQARGNQRPLTLYFQGQRGAGKVRVAEALAAENGADLLVADLKRLPENITEFETTLGLLFREAWWKEAILYIDEVSLLRREDRSAQYSILLQAVARHSGITILAGEAEWVPDDRTPSDIIKVPFKTPDFDVRQQYWRLSLGAIGASLDQAEVEILADRFRLTPAQIDNAVCAARSRALWRKAATPGDGSDSDAPQISLSDFLAAARAQCGHELAKLARKVEPKQTWDAIVLPSDQIEHLREICEQARFRHMVYDGWGFGRKLSLGKGLNVLFAGPPGTGKTMAAEVIAGELQLDVYKIDLSQVVSKYIGETEKNLDRIFTAAESANAILFFDEADALFGKRSEVKDSHDRYANIEIGYLLQKMEEYEGVAILATNLRQHLDEAFVRRMQFVVDFPFPDEEHRRRIWEVMFPHEAPLGKDIDFSALAREIKLAGGNIKNIALSAAFYAAADGRVINVTHVARAARREHQKLGRTWNESSLRADEQPLPPGERQR